MEILLVERAILELMISNNKKGYSVEEIAKELSYPELVVENTLSELMVLRLVNYRASKAPYELNRLELQKVAPLLRSKQEKEKNIKELINSMFSSMEEETSFNRVILDDFEEAKIAQMIKELNDFIQHVKKNKKKSAHSKEKVIFVGMNNYHDLVLKDVVGS